MHRTDRRNFFSRLFASMLMAGLLFSVPSLANAQAKSKSAPKLDYFSSIVRGISGPMVTCDAGFVADLSGAQINTLNGSGSLSSIRVGVAIAVEGRFVPESSTADRTVIKAVTATVKPITELRIIGQLENIDATSITLYGQQISINENTQMPFKKKKERLEGSLKIGQNLYVIADQLSQGLVARIILSMGDRADHPFYGQFNEVSGNITKLDGNNMEIANRFSFEISRVLPFPLQLKVGQFATATLVAGTASPYLTTGLSIGPESVGGANISMYGTIQNIDAENFRVTIFNRTFKVGTQFDEESVLRLFFGDGVKTIKDIKPGKPSYIGLIGLDADFFIQ